jgi:hypothetical protein
VSEEKRNEPDLSALVGQLLADPAVMGMVSSFLGSASGGGAAEKASEGEAEEGSASPTTGLATLLPTLLGQRAAQGDPPKPSDPPRGEGDSRRALLTAIRPYLNPRRQQAVDAFLQLGRMRDLLRPLR